MTRIPMQDAPERSEKRGEDHTGSALRLVHGLLESSVANSVTPEELLPKLAGAFGATAAGLAAFRDGVALVRHRLAAEGGAFAVGRWPWEERPEVVAQAHSTVAGIAVRTAEGRSLVLAASCPQDGTDWLLWLDDNGGRAWTTGERAALALAATAIGRFLCPEAGISHVVRWLEQARLQQRLEDAALIVGRLAHDFNNILTGIMGFTELSLVQAASDSTLHQYMTEVYEAAQKGASLTGQLRLFSQRNLPRPYPVSLAEATSEEISRRREAWAGRVTLEATFAADLPLVACDAVPLQQVVAHLLENARESIAAEGTVTLSARTAELTEADSLGLLGNPAAGAYVEVTVADTGSGMSPEARRRVLAEPFFSTKPRHRGLGLAVVYGVLHGYRGGMRLEPGAERGTVVRLYLPVAGPVVPSATPRATSGGLPNRAHILVVDDDPLILQLMCTTLEKAGYRVKAAADGVEALDAYTGAAEPFHLVLSDVVMPRMTGFDLTRQLLNHDGTVNVLFTSGHIPTGLVLEDFAGRNFDLLPKPFRPEGLLRAVQTALTRSGIKRMPSLAGAGREKHS